MPNLLWCQFFKHHTMIYMIIGHLFYNYEQLQLQHIKKKILFYNFVSVSASLCTEGADNSGIGLWYRVCCYEYKYMSLVQSVAWYQSLSTFKTWSNQCNAWLMIKGWAIKELCFNPITNTRKVTSTNTRKVTSTKAQVMQLLQISWKRKTGRLFEDKRQGNKKLNSLFFIRLFWV